MEKFNTINIDYLSLYKCKPHHQSDITKLTIWLKELREKHKNQNG